MVIMPTLVFTAWFMPTFALGGLGGTNLGMFHCAACGVDVELDVLALGVFALDLVAAPVKLDVAHVLIARPRHTLVHVTNVEGRGWVVCHRRCRRARVGGLGQR